MRVNGHAAARAALTIALLLPAVIGLNAVGHAQNKATPAKAETARQRYRNIKVLKDLPADQLIPTMRSFSASLGVRCDFCHVITGDRQGFERDDKPAKTTARQMITMVRNLNRREKVLGGRATCFMCHHGHEEPELAPPARPEEPAPRARPEGSAPRDRDD